MMQNILLGIGALAAARIFYTVARFWYPFIFHRSTLHRYHHGKPGSTWALVTGASDGIGWEFAVALCDSGFNVLLHGRNPVKLESKQKELQARFPGVQIRCVIADASRYEAVDSVVSAARELPGKLTVVVHNVGGATIGPAYGHLQETDAEVMDGMLNMNARFPAQLTRAIMPVLASNGPSLAMYIGSAAAIQPLPYLCVYSASKAFLMRFASSLRLEACGEGWDVEVMGVLVGNTTSAGNTHHMVGTTASSELIARTSLAKVGCGRALVWAWWVHALQEAVLGALPEALLAPGVIDMMKVRKREHEKAQ